MTGGTGASSSEDNRFIIARGTSGIWRYDGPSQTMSAVQPAY